MTTVTETEKRLALATATRRAGGTFDEVGAAVSVGRERARQIQLKAKRHQALPDWTRGLDVNTAKILLAEGYGSRREVRSAMKRGEPISRIGPTRLHALRQWLERGEQIPKHEEEEAGCEAQPPHDPPQGNEMSIQSPERYPRFFEKIIVYPDQLLDAVIDKLNLKNDAALCRALDMAPPTISNIRRRRLPVGPVLLLRMLEATRLHIQELYQLVERRVSPGSGDGILELPDDMLVQLGSKDGDTLSITKEESGDLILRRVG